MGLGEGRDYMSYTRSQKIDNKYLERGRKLFPAIMVLEKAYDVVDKIGL